MENEWQPIETAPKDGTWCLVYVPPGSNEDEFIRYVAKFDRGCWGEAGGEEYWLLLPTHWMPLPDIPDKEDE